MHDRRSVIYIISFLACIQLAGITSSNAESDASGYLNDPFTRPGIITPYTLPEAAYTG